MPTLLGIGALQNAIHVFNEHKHAAWEIVYYTEGCGVITTDGTRRDFCPGMIVCLPPGVTHSEYSELGFRNIHMISEGFSLPCDAPPVFSDNEEKDLYCIFRQLYKVFHLRPDNWIGITDSLQNTLYQYLLSMCTYKNRNRYVEALKNMLVLNISNDRLAIEDCLNEIPLSNDYMRCLFKEATGTSPLKYLMDLRIGHAKQLLTNIQNGGKKVYEIARLSGFSDPFYFARMFKKVTGKSPSKWIHD